MENILFHYFKLYDKISRNVRTAKYAPHEPEISNYFLHVTVFMWFTKDIFRVLL